MFCQSTSVLPHYRIGKGFPPLLHGSHSHTSAYRFHLILFPLLQFGYPPWAGHNSTLLLLPVPHFLHPAVARKARRPKALRSIAGAWGWLACAWGFEASLMGHSSDILGGDGLRWVRNATPRGRTPEGQIASREFRWFEHSRPARRMQICTDPLRTTFNNSVHQGLVAPERALIDSLRAFCFMTIWSRKAWICLKVAEISERVVWTFSPSLVASAPMTSSSFLY